MDVVPADDRMTNKEMAALLFNIATMLRGCGNMNPFRTAAYERGARALMGLETPAVEILQRQGKVPFRRRHHIGTKLQAKIREMAELGRLEQYAMMVADLPPHIAELMSVPGIGPKRAACVHEALGVTMAVDLVRAARDGRLHRVPGFGPKRVAQVAAIRLPEDAAPDESCLGGGRQVSLFDLPQAA